jgi:hypothetical protein
MYLLLCQLYHILVFPRRGNDRFKSKNGGKASPEQRFSSQLFLNTTIGAKRCHGDKSKRKTPTVTYFNSGSLPAVSGTLPTGN